MVSKKKIKPSTGRPVPDLFLPHPHKELSVFRIDELAPRQCRDLGQAEYADKLTPPAQLYAWTTLNAGKVLECGLGFTTDSPPDNPQHPRHANVVGWPSHTDPKEQKAQQKLKALELCEAASIAVIASEV